MNFTDKAKEIHQYCDERGCWETQTELGTRLMLIVGELGEALEADRVDKYANKELYNGTPESFKEHIKDSVEDELADSLLRILDLCGEKKIDIQWHIDEKMKYNKTRPKLHGKKY